MDLSFVIPVYNEEKTLKELHQKMLENIGNKNYEIIFIDDGSNDNSYNILQRIVREDENVKIIKFRRNFGKSAALQIGFDKAKGDIVFTLDADLQDDPDEIPRFIKKINEGYDLVAGWKKHRKDPITKKISSKIFNLITSIIFRLKLHDYNCGFKAYRNEVIKSIHIYGELHRYIPALAKAKGYKICEIPIKHHKRRFGRSKYGLERFTRGFLDLLTVTMITKYERSPLYLFGIGGLIISFIGFIVTLYLSIAKIFFGMPLSNRPLLFLGVLLIVVGVQLISIGLLGEMIVYTSKREGKNKEKEINHKNSKPG
ncbi:MAG: glycosyltransferase family 2 protein [Candidatus Cloacimonetes bacterium]|nr:glycosyltransferase family 2 protein [Candidatus Cloacimonadota bacterium]